MFKEVMTVLIILTGRKAHDDPVACKVEDYCNLPSRVKHFTILSVFFKCNSQLS